MKTISISMSALAANRNYNIGGRQIVAASRKEIETVRQAGREGRLFVVCSTGPWSETTRVVANSPEEAVIEVADTHGSEWTHEAVGSISIVPDPEWWSDWAPLAGCFGGIEDLDARIGACLSQGTTAEQAWFGRALRAMGPRGKEIVAEAVGNRGHRDAAVATEIGPFCEPADQVLVKRRSELEPSAFGQSASVAPLCGIAEHVARAQVKTGIATPFPACNPGGWMVVWHVGNVRLATVGDQLIMAP
ncbi:MAG: hypothetical protein KGR26_16915, partial [Cyanobacteria bacterium REEB65]|nr:hypothetical protein [Cyanobacteria bacterium REEB65]